jgi:phosphate-selective porin OprO/OprP
MNTEALKRLCSSMVLALLPLAMVRAQRPAPASDSTLPKEWPKKFQLQWNEYNLGYTTFWMGASWLQDYATYNQDSSSREQFPNLVRQGKIRDSRFLFSGTLRSKRPINWQTGIMYDWATSKWRIRQTLIAVGVPEIWGQIHVGRMKDGISLNRIMTGYDGWTMERFTFSDAAIPLLADGIKWLGYSPKAHLVWNLGGFTNWLSKPESFSYYQYQVVGRLARVTMDSDTAGKLLHIGAGLHVGRPQDDSLRLKSKPEVFAAPNFIDTDNFPATQGRIGGMELYFRKGPWMVGSEYYGTWVTSRQTDNPVFSGGDVSVSWNVTGETRPYDTGCGCFRYITPKRPVNKGGPGAWEAILRFSYSNLDADTLQGGKFWRVTPTVNWYLSTDARVELAYGYGNLNRFSLKGSTEFFQLRVQLQIAKRGASAD